MDSSLETKICSKHGNLKEEDVYGKNKRCRYCQREWSKNNYEKHKEKKLLRHTINAKNFRAKNPDKVKEYNKRYWKKCISECKDTYIKDTLARNSNLKVSEIPQILVQIQKQVILIKRKVEEIEDENS